MIVPRQHSTFTEEAERTCKGDFLCDKMSVSASGLLYHFDQVRSSKVFDCSQLTSTSSHAQQQPADASPRLCLSSPVSCTPVSLSTPPTPLPPIALVNLNP